MRKDSSFDHKLDLNLPFFLKNGFEISKIIFYQECFPWEGKLAGLYETIDQTKKGQKPIQKVSSVADTMQDLKKTPSASGENIKDGQTLLLPR